MSLSHRLIPLALLLPLSIALAACGSTSSFDPTDIFDLLDQKKKLVGERKPVFPQGVPGLEEGVPKNFYKGEVEHRRKQAGSAPTPAVVEDKTTPIVRSKSRHNFAADGPAASAAELATEPVAEK